MLCRSKYPFLKQNTKEIKQIINIVKLNVSILHKAVKDCVHGNTQKSLIYMALLNQKPFSS